MKIVWLAFAARPVLCAHMCARAGHDCGADVSFLRQMESRGVVFKDAGVAEPALQILKNHGYNWIRLRRDGQPHLAAKQPRLHHCVGEGCEGARLQTAAGLPLSPTTGRIPATRRCPAAGLRCRMRNWCRRLSPTRATPLPRCASSMCCPTWCRWATR